jgi:hypothetical protein
MRYAIRTDEGQAELVRRWLAGESEDEIGKSLGYERKLGRPIHDAILRFVNNQLSELRLHRALTCLRHSMPYLPPWRARTPLASVDPV